jgi:hypothetical protein
MTSRTVLDLFAGLGGFSTAFEESETWTVVQVDIDADFDPDICADVLDLRPADLPAADLIVASPPCKTFSKAAAWADHFDADGSPQTSAARESVTLVYHTLGLIRALAPDYWFLENPAGSAIKHHLGTPQARVTYCQYGEQYMKPTYLWGDHPPMTYRRCARGDACHESRSSADDGGRPMPRDPAERAKVPYELSVAIREAVEAADKNQPLKQTSLCAGSDAY